MVKFINDLYLSDDVKSKVSNIKWKTICGIGMTGVHFITLAVTGEDIFDIYPAANFKQKFFRKGNYVVLGIAGSYSSASKLIGEMVSSALNATGDINKVKEYYQDYIKEHL